MDRDRLPEHPFLTGVPDDELDAVATVGSEREFAAGEPLMSEGDFGHCAFLVEAGAAEVSVDGETVGQVGAGDVIGEVAVLRSGRRTASVVATSPMRVITFFKRDVWALEREAPEAAGRFRAAIEKRSGNR